jgi:CheY-like chemotaxis protein
LRFELLKILLVDDNHHMRLLLTEVLRAIGVREVFEAANGAEALQALRKHPIDIVMTDLSTASTSSDACAMAARTPIRWCR